MTDTDNIDEPPYLWRNRENSMDVLFIDESSESFEKSNPGELTIITWR